MRRVRGRKHPPNSKGRGTSLLQFVGTGIRDPVLARFRVPPEHKLWISFWGIENHF